MLYFIPYLELRIVSMKKYMCILLLLTVSCTQSSKRIKIKGSDTEVNLAVQLAEAFYSHHPDYVVSVSGGGSGLGIASLINGTTDIANSSRRINDEELKLFNKQGLQIDSFVFA
jgi:phosphate transport system substrate-binding protein